MMRLVEQVDDSRRDMREHQHQERPFGGLMQTVDGFARCGIAGGKVQAREGELSRRGILAFVFRGLAGRSALRAGRD
jgi:hypothetical protein